MRCPDFYKKWQRSGNFCEKDPRTAEQIDAYLDEVQILEEIATNCSTGEDLSGIAEMQISESALRPLTSEKDERIHNETAKQIVKLAHEKWDKGLKVLITGPEILEILSEVSGVKRALETEEAKKIEAEKLANVREVATKIINPLDLDSRYVIDTLHGRVKASEMAATPRVKRSETFHLRYIIKKYFSPCLN